MYWACYFSRHCIVKSLWGEVAHVKKTESAFDGTPSIFLHIHKPSVLFVTSRAVYPVGFINKDNPRRA